ncbi:hypothetical protein LJC04_01100 [Ruminococcaceae bacterium OttesenSCG-928-O06]|nr:hypothetical protein [Ruminococcaceae bacterium OttesenSCG-928-O06]
MKKQALASLLVLCGCLAACSQPAADSSASSSAPPSSSVAASSSTPPAASSSSASTFSYNITDVSFSEEVDWEDALYSDESYSFALPADWLLLGSGTQGTAEVYQFVAPNYQDTEFPSNVAVEVHGATHFFDSKEGLGERETQESFFAYIESVPISSTRTDITYSVWEATDRFIYILEYTIAREDISAHQTAYYVIGFDAPVIVYATDFSDASSPDVNEVARHIALTFGVA